MAYIPVINNARLGADAVTTDKILDGEIVNADVSASAAIAYSKLDLASSIVSGDIVDGTIVNADINATAGIEFTKLEAVPWHAGNDGTGSGLDADLLDGQEGTYYLDRANHTGTQLHTTISDFDAGVQTNSLDQLATAAADVSLGSNKITNLADGTAASDAINLGQLTAVTEGLSYKEPADLATTGNITLSGEQTIDGTLTSASRVLVKDQTTAADNGIYLTGAGAWTRESDADTAAEVDDGATVWVKGGTANGDKRFTQIDTVATLGTDDQTWVVTGQQVGSTVISDNTDVDTSAAVDGSLLRYEQSAGEWQATTSANMLLDDSGQLQLDANSQGVRVGGATGGNFRAATSGIVTIQSLGSGSAKQVRVDGVLDSEVNASGRRLSMTSVAAAGGTTTVDPITDDVFLVTNTGASAQTIELPTSPAAGQRYRIKDAGGGAATNNITISTAGAETIDGAATFAINEDYMAVDIVSDGTNYFVL